MALPNPPAQGTNPWYAARTAYDDAVETELAGKSNVGHTHTSSQITDLVPTIQSYIPDLEVLQENVPILSVTPGSYNGPVGTQLVIPTHVSPAGGQTTHPSILFFPEGWNGYKYWLGHTPYPGGNDDDEDPNLAVSNDGVNWIAAPGVSQPLDDADGQPEYNSDICLAMGPDDTMYLFWRFYDPSLATLQEKVYFRSSKDGVNWGPKTLVWAYTETVRRPVSPSFTYLPESDRWVVYAVDMLPSPNKMTRNLSVGSSPTSWGTPGDCTVANLPAGKEVWHLEVRRINGLWIGILNDSTVDVSGANGMLYLMTSRDGTAFDIGNSTSIIPQTGPGHNSLYKTTFWPQFRNGVYGFRVWYSGWTTGSPSVWNIFDSWIGPRTGHVEMGSGPIPTVVANTGGENISITFARPFMNTPTVIPTSNSGRLHSAVTAVTTTGATLRFENYTAANATGATYSWIAQEA